MRNGYKVYWTENALQELEQTLEYLERDFFDKEIRRLVEKIESITTLISNNPFIFSKSEYKQVFKVSILKYNTMYYQILENEVEILSFFSNRQSSSKQKIKK